MRNQIIDQLKKLQNKEFRDFSLRLLPDNSYAMIGVRLPELRKIAKRIIKEDPQLFLKEVKDEYFEEVMIEGFIIAYQPQSFTAKSKLIQAYLPKVTNWSLCDSFVITLKDQSESYYTFCKKCMKSKNPYTVRFGIVSFLFYFLQSDHIDEILLLLTTLNHDHYYVKMAIAWCLAESLVHHPNKTLTAMNNLSDDWTYNKTLQKARESLRFSKKEKEHLNTLKRSK